MPQLPRVVSGDVRRHSTHALIRLGLLRARRGDPAPGRRSTTPSPPPSGSPSAIGFSGPSSPWSRPHTSTGMSREPGPSPDVPWRGPRNPMPTSIGLRGGRSDSVCQRRPRATPDQHSEPSSTATSRLAPTPSASSVGATSRPSPCTTSVTPSRCDAPCTSSRRSAHDRWRDWSRAACAPSVTDRSRAGRHARQPRPPHGAGDRGARPARRGSDESGDR